jgi:hypothetical protein
VGGHEDMKARVGRLEKGTGRRTRRRTFISNDCPACHRVRLHAARHGSMRVIVILIAVDPLVPPIPFTPRLMAACRRPVFDTAACGSLGAGRAHRRVRTRPHNSSA